MFRVRAYDRYGFVAGPSLDVMTMLVRMYRYTEEPWRGYLPLGWNAPWKQIERFWINVCGPLGDPGASARLFPNASNPFQACRFKYHGQLRTRMPLACEPHYTDQSVFNAFFRRHRIGRFPTCPSLSKC